MAERVFESPHQWNIYDSTGRAALGGNFQRKLIGRHKVEMILTSLSINGCWLDRTAEEISWHHLQQDFTVVLPQILIEKKSLEEFVEELSGSYQQPTKVFRDLCRHSPDQELSFSIDPPNGSNLLKTAGFSVEYSAPSFGPAKWLFGVDQSCIKIFLDEITDSLSALDA